MEAIILAGGLGTRLSHVVSDVPKPMAPVAGRPFLQLVADELIQQGVDRLIMAVCYKKESIMDYFGDRYRTAGIVYSVEDKPLYTGGAVKKALSLCREERVLVINGDTFFPVDLPSMRGFALDRNKQAVIAVKEMREFTRYGAVSVRKNGEITAFHEKAFCARGYINGGIYDLRRDALDDQPEAFSLETDCFPGLLRKRELLAFPSDAFFVDIGIPEDYSFAQKWFGERT